MTGNDSCGPHLLASAAGESRRIGDIQPYAPRSQGRPQGSGEPVVQNVAEVFFSVRARSSDSPICAWNGFNKAWHPFNNTVYGNSITTTRGSSR
jgi:hypothetical protein